MTTQVDKPADRSRGGTRPFRMAMLRGLAVLCPPLLTVLIIVWAINTTRVYFLEPMTRWAGDGLVWCLEDVREGLRPDSPGGTTATLNNTAYRQLSNGSYVPQYVYDEVQQHPQEPHPTTGEDFYRRYVNLTYLRPQFAVPLFLAIFILLLYFLGKFMAAGIGGFFGGIFERMVLRLPGVRAVYSAVKQVTDFVFTQRDIKVTRVVAVEFPSKGIWSMGFVTGESLAAVHEAAGEPVLAVLIPYSPVPVTGCVITVPKSRCIDLDITFDQACQFIVSCGVVVPPQQVWHLREDR